MFRLTYEGKHYDCREGESVMDALLRQGVNLPFSCRNGVCHVCLQRCTRGTLPDAAQRGVHASLADKGYFLPCKCVPQTDLAIAAPLGDDLYQRALVADKEQLSPEVWRLLLEPSLELNYRAGQFVNLRRPDGLVRSYSLASVPGEDYYLELHVRRRADGAMSRWLCDTLSIGDEVEIEGPHGNCFYTPHPLNQDVLLIATGTGLGPLLGIVRDALRSGHTGALHLYHGSATATGLYRDPVLRAMTECFANFHYVPCVSRQSAPRTVQGHADEAAFAAHPDLRGWRVHLAGNAQMVAGAQARAKRAGADPAAIFADPFTPQQRSGAAAHGGAHRAGLHTDGNAAGVDRHREFAPDPEMWAALDEGRLLTTILTDFYTQVFEDPVLAPYFHGVTRQRLIEKVYSFMRQVFTGERMYFGDRPRNAHHWMVVSDAIFDHREALMTACLRRHGLAVHLIDRWGAIEESYRRDIVKDVPWKRVIGGAELPVEGFGETQLEVGSLCDGCARAIAPGETVRYHLRLGSVYCQACRSDTDAAKARP